MIGHGGFMFEASIESEARVSEKTLEGLERRLAIAKSKIQPGGELGTNRDDLPLETRAQLDKIQKDIIRNATKPVPIKIHAHAESIPLFELCKSAGVPPPPDLQAAAALNYQFQLVQVIFSIFLPKGQFPVSAELTLQISDNVQNPTRQARPVRLFPGTQHKDLFRFDLEGGVGVDTQIQMTVPMEGQQLLPFASIKTDVAANLKAQFVFGPFSYRFRKAEIEVRGESDPSVVWKYNCDSKLLGTNEFKHIFVLKVAEEATAVNLTVSAGVTPCENKWYIFLKDLPEVTDQQTLQVELLKAS